MNQERLIHLIAHRGNAMEFPENTVPAFTSALELGLRFIELDVQLSRDGIPVVIHDALLTRTTGLPGSVFEHDADELVRFEAGEPARFGERFRDVRIPRLTDALAILDRRPDVTLFVEIKRESLAQFGHDQVVTAVTSAIGERRARCVVISFDLAAVHRAREYAQVPIGWVLDAYDAHAQLKCEALRPDFVFCNHAKLPRTGALWRGPWRWALYEVRDLPLALALAERGVHYLETMAVRDMSRALRAMHDTR